MRASAAPPACSVPVAETPRPARKATDARDEPARFSDRPCGKVTVSPASI